MPLTQPDSKEAAPGAWRIRSLDGLRALSIAAVVCGHYESSTGFPLTDQQIHAYLPFGPRIGVCLFFIISGFLITTLLIREKHRFGDVSLKLFYIRRCLRIFPPFYCFMTVVTLLWVTGAVHLDPRDFAAGLFYFRDFYPGHDKILGHVWSLSIEEQFYLLWPLVIAAMRPVAGIVCSIALILLRPSVRIYRHGYMLPPGGVQALAATHFETILYGAILALVMHNPRQARTMEKACRGSWGLFVPAASLWVCYRWADFTPAALTWCLQQMRDLMLTWFMLWCVINADRWFGRFLNWKPVMWLGLISYSLYLWQQPFCTLHGWLCRFPENIGFALLAAASSYYFLERPLNLSRARFTRTAHERRLESRSAPTIKRSRSSSSPARPAR